MSNLDDTLCGAAVQKNLVGDARNYNGIHMTAQLSNAAKWVCDIVCAAIVLHWSFRAWRVCVFTRTRGKGVIGTVGNKLDLFLNENAKSVSIAPISLARLQNLIH